MAVGDGEGRRVGEGERGDAVEEEGVGDVEGGKGEGDEEGFAEDALGFGAAEEEGVEGV